MRWCILINMLLPACKCGCAQIHAEGGQILSSGAVRPSLAVNLTMSFRPRRGERLPSTALRASVISAPAVEAAQKSFICYISMHARPPACIRAVCWLARCLRCPHWLCCPATSHWLCCPATSSLRHKMITWNAAAMPLLLHALHNMHHAKVHMAVHGCAWLQVYGMLHINGCRCIPHHHHMQLAAGTLQLAAGTLQLAAGTLQLAAGTLQQLLPAAAGQADTHVGTCLPATRAVHPPR
jgi:hypothetical protein